MRCNPPGNTIRLYLASIAGASNVRGFDSIAGEPITSMSKVLLLDLVDPGLPLDNSEGVTFGGLLPDGRRSLILVSDNHFAAGQFTRFLAFAVDSSSVPLPPTLALIAAGLPGLRRRRA